MASQDSSTLTQPPDTTVKETYTFFTLIIKMGHNQRNSLKDYWSGEKHYYTPFYSNVTVHNHFFYNLRFLRFVTDDPPNHDDPDYDRLQKIKIFDTLNNEFCEMCNTTEHLSLNEVIVLYKGRVIFWQYIPKKQTIWHQNLQALQLSRLHL
jgi:hypothetical protein